MAIDAEFWEKAYTEHEEEMAENKRLNLNSALHDYGRPRGRKIAYAPESIDRFRIAMESRPHRAMEPIEALEANWLKSFSRTPYGDVLIGPPSSDFEYYTTPAQTMQEMFPRWRAKEKL